MTRMHPDDEFYFIVGTDVANGVPNWDTYPEIIKRVRLAIAPRKGYPDQLDIGDPHVRIQEEIEGLSSSDWRRLYHERSKLASSMIPPPVCEYIKLNHLYVNPPDAS
jgi:nicotinate-nucleotide adenylyltransferase